MSVAVMLAAAVAFTPLQPEPVQFDIASVEKELGQSIQMELTKVREVVESKELNQPVEVVDADKERSKRKPI